MHQGIDWLRDAVATGEIHTVRVSFGDRLGAWRGKRVPAGLFLQDVDRPLGFCDGMLVCDVHANLVQEVGFSNYETGYPDVYVHPNAAAIRPVGWVLGEALVFGDMRNEHGRIVDVAPRSALTRVAERAALLGHGAPVRLALRGRLMRTPTEPCDLELSLVPSEADRVLTVVADGLATTGFAVDEISVRRGGAFELRLAPLDARTAGEAGIIAKGALKEVARRAGLEAVFMTRVPGDPSPATWTVEVPLVSRADPGAMAIRLTALTEDVRGLIAPSITAFRAGHLPSDVRASNGQLVVVVAASAEASPETTVAVAIAAAVVATESAQALPSQPPTSLRDAAQRLAAAAWALDWLGRDLPINSGPLLSAEQDLFEGTVTDWELERYWKAS